MGIRMAHSAFEVAICCRNTNLTFLKNTKHNRKTKKTFCPPKIKYVLKQPTPPSRKKQSIDKKIINPKKKNKNILLFTSNNPAPSPKMLTHTQKKNKFTNAKKNNCQKTLFLGGGGGREGERGGRFVFFFLLVYCYFFGFTYAWATPRRQGYRTSIKQILPVATVGAFLFFLFFYY